MNTNEGQEGLTDEVWGEIQSCFSVYSAAKRDFNTPLENLEHAVRQALQRAIARHLSSKQASPAEVSSDGLQEAFAKFVIKHLGPNALAGDGMSIYDVATLAFSAGANWQSSCETAKTDTEIAELIEWLHHRAKYAEQEAEESNRKNERVHICVSWATEAKRYRAAASALNQRLAVKDHTAEAVRELVEALRDLEECCDRRAALTSGDLYLKMHDEIPGMRQALYDLDEARAAARAALAAHQQDTVAEKGEKCRKCGDILTGHEDESGSICRWCGTGWVASDENNSQSAGPADSEDGE